MVTVVPFRFITVPPLVVKFRFLSLTLTKRSDVSGTCEAFAPPSMYLPFANMTPCSAVPDISVRRTWPEPVNVSICVGTASASMLCRTRSPPASIVMLFAPAEEIDTDPPVAVFPMDVDPEPAVLIVVAPVIDVAPVTVRSSPISTGPTLSAITPVVETVRFEDANENDPVVLIATASASPFPMFTAPLRFEVPLRLDTPPTVAFPVTVAFPATERLPSVETLFPTPGLMAIEPERVSPVSEMIKLAATPVLTVITSPSPLPRLIAPLRFETPLSVEVPVTVRLLFAVTLPVTSTAEPTSVSSADVLPMDVAEVLDVLMVVVPRTSTVEPLNESGFEVFPIVVTPEPTDELMFVVPAICTVPEPPEARRLTPLFAPPTT